MFQKTLLITTLIASSVLMGCSYPAQARESCPAGTNTSAQELLKDPQFAQGVRHLLLTNYDNGPEKRVPSDACVQRWTKKHPEIKQASWGFVEYAENTFFCQNPETPYRDKTGLVYSSLDDSKQFKISPSGTLTFKLDTNKEWRAGCNLSKADNKTHQAPIFKDTVTTWPHFLITQAIKDTQAKDKKLWVQSYSTLKLDASILFKGTPAKPKSQCEGEPKNHEIFYIAFVLYYKDHPKPIAIEGSKVNTIYALVPLLYSEDGINHHKTSGLMPDQVGNGVYFVPNQPYLVSGANKQIELDARDIAEQSIAAFNKVKKTNIPLNDFYIAHLLMGFEVWGGFKSEVQVSDLSFKAIAKSCH